MTDIIVRKMPFEFPDDIQAHWCPGRPEWSHMVNGASLAMPYLEPYLIRTMRKAHKQLDSETLKIDLQHLPLKMKHFLPMTHKQKIQ